MRSFPFAEAGKEAEDRQLRVRWGQRSLDRQGKTQFSVASAVSWLAELVHWRVELQAGGAPAEQAFMGAVRAKALQD